MEIWVNLEFGDGNFECGFSNINLKVTGGNAQRNITQLEVQLPPDTEIAVFYQRWKEQYYSLLNYSRSRFKNSQVTHISKKDCYDSAQCLRYQLHQWLHPIQLKLEQALPQNPLPEIHLVIHTEKIASLATKDILHRLPWQEWDFLAQKFSCEAAVCFHSSVASPTASEESSIARKIRRARILSIFGDSTNIDTSADKELLEKLQKRAAELIVLTEPNRSDFNALWEEPCDILFFAGHSETQGDGQTGVININPKDSLSLEEIKRTLRAAINKGLKLAIFNSCNGLGLARQLASLNLPYIIVWREEVPDKLAQKFLQYFLSSFSQGESLFNSVRQARDKLSELANDRDIAKQLPGVSWLPIICQNTTESPPSWQDLGGLSGELPDCPYQGLSVFRQENADFFFGREKFIASLVEAVNSNSLVAVIGASGSGKSSVVFAGLIPRLEATGDVEIISFRPGKNPFDTMAVALSKYCQYLIQGQTDSRLAELEFEVNLRHHETALCHLIENIVNSSEYHHLVLVADQFEELYTLTPEDERYSFLQALLFAVNYAPRFTLVLTMRADFYGYALSYRPFSDALQGTIKNLGSMNEEELRDAIEKPAAKMKVELEEGLTSRIINDLGNQPGHLPLLEFTLTQLWSKQKNWYLTHQAYEDIGGLNKALAKYADAVLYGKDEVEKFLLEQVFIQLVRPGEGTEDTRRVATQKEIGQEKWNLVQHLADKRLVVTGTDETTQEKTVEIIHEALICEWETLKEWIKKNRDFRIWQERLKPDVQEWLGQDKKHQVEALLQGTRLAIGEEWYNQRKNELTEDEQNFISESIKRQKKQQRQAKLKQFLTILGLTGGLATVSFFAANSEIRRTDAEVGRLSSTSERFFSQYDYEAALTYAIEAGKLLKGSIWKPWIASETRMQSVSTLQEVVYGDRIKTLKGHLSWVGGVSFSPDGKTVASASRDKTVKLWDISTGKEIKTLKGHSLEVRNISFSPDGKTLASASGDKTVKLWDISTGKEIQTLQGHSSEIWGVSFSPDGKTVASASGDKTVKLWDISTGKEIQTLQGHSLEVRSISFSPDGKTLASASADKTVKLWDTSTGQEIQTLKGHSSEVWGISFSLDGKTLASASADKTVKLWDTSTGQEIQTLKGHSSEVWGVSFSPDGKTLASASADKTVKLWDTSTGREIQTLQGHSAPVLGVSFSSDGKTVASASLDGMVKLWNTNTRSKIFKGHSSEVWGVSFSPDGKTVASASGDKTVKLWDTSTGREIKTLKGHLFSVLGISFSPDGKTVASASGDKTVKLWDTFTGREIQTLQGHSAPVLGVSFSSDGKTVASASSDRTVKLWDTSTGKEIKTLQGHSLEVWGVSFSPDGKTLASASLDGTVKLWDTSTGKEIKTFKGHSAKFLSVSFSPDGKTLASASEDQTVKLWDTSTGREIKTLQGHLSQVRGVSFSPDSTTLASASLDGTVKLWDISTGREIKTLKGYSSKFLGVSFNPNGKTLASASLDGTVILWNLNLEDLLMQGCDLVRDYLQNNPDISNEDRDLCKGVKTILDPKFRTEALTNERMRDTGSKRKQEINGSSLQTIFIPSIELRNDLLEKNLIINGDAEAGLGALNDDTSVEQIPGWSVIAGKFTTAKYGGSGLPSLSSPGPKKRGSNLFTGGPGSPISSAFQEINISKLATNVDAGTISYYLEAYLGGWEDQEDDAEVEVSFLSAKGQLLEQKILKQVSAKERNNKTGLLRREALSKVPKNTRKIRLQIIMTRISQVYNDGYVDNLSLKLFLR